MTNDLSVFSRVRNFWNLGSLNNNPEIFSNYDRKLIAAAARVRIHTSKIKNLSWTELIGQRDFLKLAIVSALNRAGDLPNQGLIDIDRLSFYKKRDFKGFDLLIFHLDQPPFELPLLEACYADRTVIIKGFYYRGEEIKLADPFIIDL